MSEAKAALGGPALDGRKLSAYQFWQIVTKDGDRLKLIPRGWELARKAKPEQTGFRETLDSVPAYRSALEWAFHQKMDSATNVDVAAHWHEHHSEAVGTDNENTIKDQAVCFFRLCEAAELGEMVVGRRGQPTRFNFVRAELGKYIEAGPSEPPWVEPPRVPIEAPTDSSEVTSETTKQAQPEAVADRATGELRVFISHGKNTELVEQVETMLGLADIKSDVAIKKETAAIPVPDMLTRTIWRWASDPLSPPTVNSSTSGKSVYSVNGSVWVMSRKSAALSRIPSAGDGPGGVRSLSPHAIINNKIGSKLSPGYRWRSGLKVIRLMVLKDIT